MAMLRVCRRVALAFCVLAAALAAALLGQRRVLYVGAGSVDPTPTRRGGIVVSGPGFAGLWFAPRVSGAAVVVFWHGNADLVGRSPSWLARRVSNVHGAGFLAAEYPGYGILAGEPDEAGFYSSAEAALAHLTRPEADGGLGVQPQRVTLAGQSIGAAVALEMAARGHGARVVLLSPFSSTAEVAYSWLPLGGLWRSLLRALLSGGLFDNLSRAPAVAAPVCVLHGDADGVVPDSQGRELADALPQSRFVSLRGAGHNNVWSAPDSFSHFSRCAGLTAADAG
eukprot:TRINITY_DN22553_c0_g1_i1.p1 TRINITY_DN22553_c0_g1~~TRINITY_DN22553_c0_g1_i1.p1  ORF type:complete len:298 (+),score=105.52 TRINITY_DN22553_c0_g1_i1:50-895(+)